MDNRRAMMISVTVLGVSIAAFMFAYMAFGDNTDEDMKTLKQVNVSTKKNIISRLKIELEAIVSIKLT